VKEMWISAHYNQIGHVEIQAIFTHEIHYFRVKNRAWDMAQRMESERGARVTAFKCPNLRQVTFIKLTSESNTNPAPAN